MLAKCKRFSFLARNFLFLNLIILPRVETTEDKRTRMDELYRHGHLTDIYEQLNNDPETSSDASLLFQLARATYKLGK